MAYKNIKRWARPAHYIGADWPEHYSSGVGQTRDSSALERSNFACMLRNLGGESETVTVVQEGHWAVGWVEWIAIHETDSKALQTADEIMGALEDYPVIDESHWSDLEQEDAEETWANCFSDAERLDYVRRFRNQFEFHDYADMIGCIRGKWFGGYASELLA